MPATLVSGGCGLLVALFAAAPAAAQVEPLPAGAVARVGADTVTRNRIALSLLQERVTLDVTDDIIVDFRARYRATTLCADGYVVRECGQRA